MDSNTTLLLVGIAAIVVIWVGIVRKWINSPARTIERHIAGFMDGEIPDPPERAERDGHSISLEPNGFRIVPLSGACGEELFFAWNSVQEATAFKRDLFSTDRVCIAFRLADGIEIEVHEEMQGWVDLCDAMPAFLPGTPAWKEWFMEITTPAFELKPTILFRRDTPAAI